MKQDFNINYLLKYTFRYKKEFIIAILANILFSLVLVGYAELFRIFFDNAQKGFVDSIYDNLLRLFLLLCLQGTLHYIASRYTRILHLKIKKQLQSESIFNVIDGYILDTNKLHHGEWMNISLDDTDQIANLGSNILIRAIHIILKTVIFVVYLFTINTMLAIIALFFSPIMLLLGKIYTSRMKFKSKTASESKAKLTSNISEFFQKSLLFKLNPSRKFLLNKVDKLLDENYSAENTLDKVRQEYDELSSVLGQAGNVIILSIGAFLIAKREMTTGSLVAFMQIMNQIIWPLVSLSSLYGNYNRTKAKFTRLDLINHLSKDDNEIVVKDMEPLIQVNKLSFNIENNQIFNNISFNIYKGDWICIVGENGTGKTTLLNLLSGLYKPSSGEIIYNNDIFNNVKLIDKISYSQQSNGLFMGTIKENLLFHEDIQYENELKAILKDLDLMKDLPEGIDSELQQSGNNFSGGQKQKLLLARLFTSRKDIVFLDEPLSAIDIENKNKLKRMISLFLKDKTCITIDHDFQFITYANKILFIDNYGRIDLASHDILFKKNTNYKKLIEMIVKEDCY